MNDLEKAAVAYAQSQTQGFDRAVECEQGLKEAARAYAASLANFGPGLDPAPPSLAPALKDARRITALETLLRRARQCVMLARGEGAEVLEREIDAAIPRGADE